MINCKTCKHRKTMKMVKEDWEYPAEIPNCLAEEIMGPYEDETTCTNYEKDDSLPN